MRDHLLFTIAAPLASWGAVSVGERRPSWDRPAKSQVVGLLAGALGIERADEMRQLALAASLGFAVRIDDPGQPATDYHTAQSPPQRRNRRFATRADELAVPKDELKTILSRREYRTGVQATVCVWLRQPGPATLDEMKEKLAQPEFTPFAGRKAHALMAPMDPRIEPATDVLAALAAYDAGRNPKATELLDNLRDPVRMRWHTPIVFVDADDTGDLAIERLEQRRDHPESRAKWRFGVRAEAVLRHRPNTIGGAS
ncbi:MAG: type I-E CRISPR-associated protein Cas5/CasD [Hyphomicrobiaceae bacterium]